MEVLEPQQLLVCSTSKTSACTTPRRWSTGWPASRLPSTLWCGSAALISPACGASILPDRSPPSAPANLQLFQVLFAGSRCQSIPWTREHLYAPFDEEQDIRAMDACDVIDCRRRACRIVVRLGAARLGPRCAGHRSRHLPANKLCGGWITPLVLDELGFTPRDYSPGRTLQPITGFRLSAIGGPQVEIRSDHVVSYGIRRCEFDEYLLRRSGARLREGMPLTSIERLDGGWLINGDIRARDAGRRRRALLSRRPLSWQQGITRSGASAGNRV